jgi:hypothetical protein
MRRINITLAFSGQTIEGPSGRTQIVGGTETIIPAIAGPGVATITIVYGGITAEFPRGRITVLEGTTTTIAATESNTTPTSVLGDGINGIHEQSSTIWQSVSDTRGQTLISRSIESASATGSGSRGSRLYIIWGLVFTLFLVQITA